MLLKLYLGQELIIKSLFGSNAEIEFIVNKKTKSFATVRFYKYNLQMDIPSMARLDENDICRIDKHMRLVSIKRASYTAGTTVIRR